MRRGDPGRQSSRKRLLNESSEAGGRSASEPAVISKTRLSSVILPNKEKPDSDDRSNGKKQASPRLW